MFSTTRRKTAVLATVLATVIAGVAFAFWTSNGSGTGTGTVANDGGTLAIAGTFPADELVPGGDVDVSFSVDNANTSALELGTIEATDIATSDAGCLPAWFSMADVSTDDVVAGAATGHAVAEKGSLEFADAAVNQDACKGATVTLTLASSSIPAP